MKKKYQVIGLIILMICAIVYDFQTPENGAVQKESKSYVVLEGEFQTLGKYVFTGHKLVCDIIKEVGVKDNANMKALTLDMEVMDESRLYLPPVQENCVSLNHASQDELMTLKGIGEKTALKIIDYRQTQPFLKIEDIMNVSGIGEKTYLRLREYLCL